MKKRISQISRQLCIWLPTSLTALFGLQMLRTLLPSFVGYLRDANGMAPLDLAPIAVGIFALSFLAGPLNRLAGTKPGLWVTMGGLAILRIAEQVSTSPALDLYFSAAGVALFLMSIPIQLNLKRSQGVAGTAEFGYAFLLGVSLDTAIHIAGGTLDLTWQPGPLPIAIIVILAAALILSLRASLNSLEDTAPAEGNFGRTLALAALGPWLFLQLLVYQNVARVSALSGLETPGAGAFVLLANTIGIWAAGRAANGRTGAFGVGVLGLFIFTQLHLFAEPTGISGLAVLLVGHILSFYLVMVVLAGLGLEAMRKGSGNATIANGIGQILFVLLTFVYYVTYDIALGFRSGVLLPVTALMVAVGAIIGRIRWSAPAERAGEKRPALTAAALLVMPLALFISWKNPMPEIPTAGNQSVRVMTYNLHNGFNTEGRLDMEAIAQAIETMDPEVIALQEISRGWLIWGSLDMLTWLSQRLDMPYVYGPTADAQWGNAILSRYPILSYELLPYSTEEVLLLRGYIVAEIDIGGGTFTMVATHFSHTRSQGAVREIQASELLSTWSGGAHTVILGDLNALPEDREMRLLANGGLVDAAVATDSLPGYTIPADDPDSRYDYIWGSPDLLFSDFEILVTRASDHLPVAVRIRLE